MELGPPSFPELPSGMPSRGDSAHESISAASSPTSRPNGSSSPTGSGVAVAASAPKEKKRRGLLGLKSPFKFMGGGKIFCQVRRKTKHLKLGQNS